MPPFPSKPEGLATALELCVLRGFEVRYVPTRMSTSFASANSTTVTGYIEQEAHYIVTRMIPDRRGLDARMVRTVTVDQQGIDNCLALLRVPDSKLHLHGLHGETVTAA